MAAEWEDRTPAQDAVIYARNDQIRAALYDHWRNRCKHQPQLMLDICEALGSGDESKIHALPYEARAWIYNWATETLRQFGARAREEYRDEEGE